MSEGPSRDRGASDRDDRTAADDADATRFGPDGRTGEAGRGDDRRDREVDRAPGEPGDREDEPSLAAVLGATEGEGRRDLVPGDPSLEHALFVLLGVLFATFVIYRAYGAFVGW